MCIHMSCASGSNEICRGGCYLSGRGGVGCPGISLRARIHSVRNKCRIAMSASGFTHTMYLSITSGRDMCDSGCFSIRPGDDIRMRIEAQLSTRTFGTSLELAYLGGRF